MWIIIHSNQTPPPSSNSLTRHATTMALATAKARFLSSPIHSWLSPSCRTTIGSQFIRQRLPIKQQQHGSPSSRYAPNNVRRWNSSSNSNNKLPPSNTTGSSTNTETTKQTFLERFLAPKPMPPRWTPKWYGEMVLICTVFGITGTSTMVLVRPAVSDVLGLKGSFKEGERCC